MNSSPVRTFYRWRNVYSDVYNLRRQLGYTSLSTSFQHQADLVELVGKDAVLAQIVLNFLARMYDSGVVAAAELLPYRRK